MSEARPVKLTKAQAHMLARYDGYGGYPTPQVFGRSSTWNVLLRRGLISRSGGLGVIETVITPAGRAALNPKEGA